MPRLLTALLIAALASPAFADPAPVPVHLLDGPNPLPTGISFGLPYPRGQVHANDKFAIGGTNAQSWPLAYWPDGSIKWMGFATVAPANLATPLKVDAPPAGIDIRMAPLSAKETDTAIDIDARGVTCHISKTGNNLFDSLSVNNVVIAKNAHLDMILQHGPETDPANPPPRERFISNIKKVTLEQSGPVRAVVKIEGTHKSTTGNREFLPFVVRLYFYNDAGLTGHGEPLGIKIVHTFFFDGNEKEDFIRGLGITADVPFREEIQNRHVRFSGEEEADGKSGLWTEPVEPLLAYQGSVSDNDGNVYPRQVEGQRIPKKADLNPRSAHLIDALAAWSDFRLIQPNADGFTIEKRTSADSSWLTSNAGKRDSGLAFIGDVSGGLAVGIKNFWQSYPAELDVSGARSDTAHLTAWLWSPNAPAMDMRHYDTVAHGLNESYEDVQPGLSTPYGIARTSELMLFPTKDVPSKETFEGMMQENAAPPVLVAAPEYYHDQKAFGYWALKDTSTPFKKAVETELDNELAYYQKAVDQWNWYGFWHFGNIMHSYDSQRHEWRYDVGGFAWDNDEQGTDMWLWYSFLRSGRPDLFRMAEAMSRLTGEVISYHFGPLAGLGSRHNVSEWGDGAKEARISMAPYRRFYYYLTTDERTGDTMHDTLQADVSITHMDPMREALPRTPDDDNYPARIRGGPDWFAFAGNWMTEWERTNQPKYHDKIEESVKSIAAMPYWFRTSQDLTWHFFPDTGKLLPRDQNAGGYNLVNNMGGPEIMMELCDFLDDPQWTKIYLQYCRLTNAPADVLKKDQETGTEGADARYAGGGRLAGYAYYKTHDVAYAKKAIGAIALGGGNFSSNARDLSEMNHLAGPDAVKPTDEAANGNGIITNGINQSSLNTIEVLELCKDQLPTEVPPPQPARGGRGFGRGGAFGGRRGGRGATPPPTTEPARAP
ncbi:MAG TPA: hypothetical protein VHQ47_05335 [Phycisphaerae bacterium]|nr:hypothetical protein [Phycisphaerae bacterium]